MHSVEFYRFVILIEFTDCFAKGWYGCYLGWFSGVSVGGGKSSEYGKKSKHLSQMGPCPPHPHP